MKKERPRRSFFIEKCNLPLQKCAYMVEGLLVKRKGDESLGRRKNR